MYNFELQKDEKIKKMYDDIFLKLGNDNVNVSVIITNKRFIIFSIPRDIESFRVGRIINVPYQMEIIFETVIDNIKEIEKMGDYYKYILLDSNYFLLSSNCL